MSVSRVWQGPEVFNPSGSLTPFGIYDSDARFIADAPKVASYCATRLGYPIVDIELLSENFYACFEEAISEYSAQVNQFNIRNNLGSLTGNSTEINHTGKVVHGNELNNIFRVADSYGTYAGVGGTADNKRGYVELEVGKQTYDLQALWGNVSESNQRIDITKVYHETTPAISRFFDPYSTSGQGTMNLIDEFGFGSFSPAAQFILMPMYEDMLRIQAIEFNDEIRKSAYTFELINNELRVFPIPTAEAKIQFQFLQKKWKGSRYYISALQGYKDDICDAIAAVSYECLTSKIMQRLPGSRTISLGRRI